MNPGLFRLTLAFVVLVHHLSSFGVGSWAVDVFFILSGYWVSRMFDLKYSKLDRPLLAFYGSRWLRLLPVFLVCIYGGSVIMTFGYGRDSPEVFFDAMSSPIWHLRTWLIAGSANQVHFLPLQWSLDVEMQFYLVAPFLMALAQRNLNLFSFLTFLAFLWAFFLSFHGVLLAAPRLDFHIGFFMVGILMEFKARCHVGGVVVAKSVCRRILEYGPWFILAGLMAVRILFPNITDVNRAEFPEYGVICVILFLAALTAVPAVWYSVARKSSRFDRHLGNLTFPLYLFHTLVATGYYHLRSDIPFLASGAIGKAVGSGLVVVISIVGSILIYALVDIPFERIRRRWMQQFCAREDSANPIPKRL